MNEESVAPTMANADVINIVSVARSVWVTVVTAVVPACPFLGCVDLHIAVPLIMILFHRHVLLCLPRGHTPHGLVILLNLALVFTIRALRAPLLMAAFGPVLRVFMPLPLALPTVVRTPQTNALVALLFLP
jgi:hypothetical protein